MKIATSQLKKLIKETVQEGMYGGNRKIHLMTMLKQVADEVSRLPEGSDFEGQLEGLSFVENYNGTLVLVIGKTSS